MKELLFSELVVPLTTRSLLDTSRTTWISTVSNLEASHLSDQEPIFSTESDTSTRMVWCPPSSFVDGTKSTDHRSMLSHQEDPSSQDLNSTLLVQEEDSSPVSSMLPGSQTWVIRKLKIYFWEELDFLWSMMDTLEEELDTPTSARRRWRKDFVDSTKFHTINKYNLWASN